MAELRRQTYTLETYLRSIREHRIRKDADVARYFVWNSEQISELIVTILTEDYMPPIILAEREGSGLWVVDGGQRSMALNKFRYGNYKMTSVMGNPVISYKKEGGEDSLELRNLTYERLPDEWKKKFDSYPIETVIYEHCDAHSISEYMRRYNNHTHLNTDQMGLTYLDHFAAHIREITNSNFFIECCALKEKEKIKGAAERTVVETVMCMYHLDKWNKHMKPMCKYLNDNASKEQFDQLSRNLCRLEKVITDETKHLFNRKEAFLYLTLFDRFTKSGSEDRKFAAFLKDWDISSRKRQAGSAAPGRIGRDSGTKERAAVVSTLEMLERRMTDYLKKGEDVLW